MTPVDFARALLRRLNLPVTDNNVNALIAFQKIESGHQANGAWFNPLNTMRGAPGARDANLQVKGIKAYSSWDEGLEATAKTIAQPNMSGIFNSLRASANPDDTLRAIHVSPWGWDKAIRVAPASAYLAYGNIVYRPVAGVADFFAQQWSKPVVKYGAIIVGSAFVIGFGIALVTVWKKSREA